MKISFENGIIIAQSGLFQKNIKKNVFLFTYLFVFNNTSKKSSMRIIELNF